MIVKIFIGLLVIVSVFVLIDFAFGEALTGGPLPEPWITEESHERVLEATGLSREDFPPMDHAYWHWLASGHTLNVLQFFHAQQLALVQAELELCRNPPPPPGPVCDVIENWSGGNLYKPRSDNTGNPVFLIGDEFGSRLQCEVFNGLGNKILDCKFRTCCPNGGRAHFDVPRRCSSLRSDAPILIRVIRNGVHHCWDVNDPCDRLE